MLTLFAIPKAFHDHTAVIQRNAIQSWLSLRPQCEVILLGDDQGTAEVATEFNIRHIPDVARNEHGTPLVNSIFTEAESAATYPVLCYVNADIILMNDFLQGVQRALEYKPYSLIVGRRWDVEVQELLEFSSGWERRVAALTKSSGTLHAHTGIDYFVFTRGTWKQIPPFAIGRSAWDSWLVYKARSEKVPIIDLTEVTTVVHQNHDYSHHPQGADGVWKGEEAQRNSSLAGGYTHAFTVLDSQYKLTSKGLVRMRFHPFRIYRSLVTLSTSVPILKPALKIVRSIRGKFLS